MTSGVRTSRRALARARWPSSSSTASGGRRLRKRSCSSASWVGPSFSGRVFVRGWMLARSSKRHWTPSAWLARRHQSEPKHLLLPLERAQRRPGAMKTGRVAVIGAGVAGPEWSARHLEEPSENVAEALLGAFGAAISRELPTASSCSTHLWRFARTTQPLALIRNTSLW